MDRLLMVTQRMVDAIVQLRAGQVHNQNNLIVIDDDSSSEETIAEAPEVPEQFHLVPIEDIVEDSEGEEDDEEEIWEIS